MNEQGSVAPSGEGQERNGRRKMLRRVGAATAALFPATFADSDLGPIPSGWRATTVRACVAEVFDGPHATPPDATCQLCYRTDALPPYIRP
jgi:hypothetical protein